MRYAPLAVLAALALAAPPAHAAETCAGTINVLPAQITSQGTWCLAKNLGTSLASGTALRIGAPNVTIDCRGFRISGAGAGTGTMATGIGSNGKYNATVRNCRLVGFHTGVALEGAGYGHLVEDNVVDTTVRGLVVAGDGSRVRRNRLLGIGGSTSAPGGAWGIVTTGGVDVDANLIDGVAATPDSEGLAVGVGVLMNDADDVVVEGNRIRRIVGAGGAGSMGIRVLSGTGAIVRRNHLAAVEVGVRCVDTANVALDNDFSHVGTPVAGCVTAGTSVVVP